MRWCAAALSIALGLGAGPAAADTLCEYESYRGARTDEIARSWLGTGFVVDVDEAKIRRVYDNLATGWTPVKIVRAESFTSASYQATEMMQGGQSISIRWGFRVYDDGRCEAMLESRRMEALIAVGKTLR